MSLRHALVIAALLTAPACADDPRYVDALDPLDSDPAAAMGVTATIQIPVSTEKLARDEEDRAMLEAELGVMVPTVRLDDLSVSIEWSLTNTSDVDGMARIHVNGGNEWFFLDPQLFVIDPEEDEPPPPLMGDIPIQVPAGGLVTGVFREDQVIEASIDMELIGRGGLNPIAAVLEVHEDTQEIVPMAGGTAIPREAFAGMVRFDFVFLASTTMTLNYTIRVRDHRDILHRELMSAPTGELTVFNPVAVQPPPPAN
jgi:hypothetical protein